MSVLAISATWATPVAPETVPRMLAAVAQRRGLYPGRLAEVPFATFGITEPVRPGTPTTAFTHAATAEPGAAFAITVAGPFYDDAAGLLGVVDARIDNRGELEALLGCPPAMSNHELVVRGYQRWGPDVADRICGDFAIAIWDVARRTLYAARDPFGVRGLYFAASSDGILASTDVEAMLGFVDRRAIDEQMVLDYLLTDFVHHRRTFFRDIARLRPGHSLLASAGSCRQVRYFRPPATASEPRFSTAADYEAEFRRLLTQSIRDRLPSDRPVVAHLSGGLDSTSIVLLADEIYKADPNRFPPLVTASAVFPGLDCDESAAIQATRSRVAFAGRLWSGLDARWEHLDNPSLAWPGSPAGISGGSTGDLDIARDLGAEAILSGNGGDEVAYAGGVFRDLAAAGQWRTLWREAAMFGPDRRRAFLEDSLIGVLPRRVVAIRRALKPVHAGPPPGWLGPALRETWPGRPDEQSDALPDNEADGASLDQSFVQQMTWRALSIATAGIPMDYQRHYGATAGVDMRFPFLDRRLVRFVLGIPYQHRLPGGFMRGLQWKALADRIAPEVFVRVTTAESARAHQARSGFGRYRDLFEGRRWLCGDLVDQRLAREVLDRMILHADGASAATRDATRGFMTVHRIATLETWLRAVFGYSAVRRNSYARQ